MYVVVFIRYNFKKHQVSWEKISNVVDEKDIVNAYRSLWIRRRFLEPSAPNT